MAVSGAIGSVVLPLRRLVLASLVAPSALASELMLLESSEDCGDVGLGISLLQLGAQPAAGVATATGVFAMDSGAQVGFKQWSLRAHDHGGGLGMSGQVAASAVQLGTGWVMLLFAASIGTILCAAFFMGLFSMAAIDEEGKAAARSRRLADRRLPQREHFTILIESLLSLHAGNGPIEILGPSGYPAYYVALPEYAHSGRRLELATTPTWEEPEASVGPMPSAGAHRVVPSVREGPGGRVVGTLEAPEGGTSSVLRREGAAVLKIDAGARAQEQGLFLLLEGGEDGQHGAVLLKQGGEADSESLTLSVSPGSCSSVVVTACAVSTLLMSPKLLETAAGVNSGAGRRSEP